MTLTTRDPAASVEVPAEQRSKYTLAFVDAFAFSATADCNQVFGSWVATAEGGLTITPGPSTIVACPEGSYGDLYILALTNTESYAIAGATLTLTLADGGTLGFEPAP